MSISWDDPDLIPPTREPLPTGRLDRALYLRNGLTDAATNGSMDSGEYRELRREFMTDSRTRELLPSFTQVCHDIGDFWEFIKHEFPTYAERRKFLREQFAPLLSVLEQTGSPPEDLIRKGLTAFSAAEVSAAWHKALERAESDPEGAITAARSLLETVCLHILEYDPAEKAKGPADDLPKLFRRTSELLNLSPALHSEQVFKQILGGAVGVVEGLGALRNKLGDAHGKGPRPVRVSPRHAHFAVNLAGSVALFLVETRAAREAHQ